MQEARVRGGMPGVASLHVLLLVWGRNIGVWCADFSPLVILLSFSLDSNSFGDETGKALAQALTTNTSLKVLRCGGEMPAVVAAFACSAACLGAKHRGLVC